MNGERNVAQSHEVLGNRTALSATRCYTLQSQRSTKIQAEHQKMFVVGGHSRSFQIRILPTWVGALASDLPHFLPPPTLDLNISCHSTEISLLLFAFNCIRRHYRLCALYVTPLFNSATATFLLHLRQFRRKFNVYLTVLRESPLRPR